MVADGEYTAVLDRFEEDDAVLLLERDGDQVDQVVVDWRDLPRGVRQDAVLDVRVADGEVVDAAYDREATARRRDAAQDRFDRLARRPPKKDEE
ncbi:DUF3006 domain-containing protein [Halobacteriaceae archaeon GCM10025711]